MISGAFAVLVGGLPWKLQAAVYLVRIRDVASERCVIVKGPEPTPEVIFCKCFDEAVANGVGNLRQTGIDEERIWRAFRAAVHELQSIAADVETQPRSFPAARGSHVRHRPPRLQPRKYRNP